ncbi:MAG: HAD-IA family hydrolase [Chloroflexi bacterium]|nr:HAD-IA family hydrolase [Chloroflexota bacterium]
MFLAVIFDRDGVLTEFDIQAGIAYFESLLPISIYDLASRWKKWGAKTGFPRNLLEETKFWSGFWDNLSSDLNLPLSIRTRLHYVDYKLFLQPFADAYTALLTARKHGLRTGVLSNFTLASLYDSLIAVGLAELVDAACSATVIGAAKPKPAAYLTISQTLITLPHQCLFFDDEPDNVAGAQALGMSAYLVDRQRKTHDLPHHVVCDLTALPLILRQSQTIQNQ